MTDACKHCLLHLYVPSVVWLPGHNLGITLLLKVTKQQMKLEGKAVANTSSFAVELV
jgi:hypothetical protein